MFHLRRKYLFWENKYGFNLTMSYRCTYRAFATSLACLFVAPRTDSSLYHPYGTVYEAFKSVTNKGYTKDLDTLMKAKKKLAVAFVSNCNSTAGASIRLQLLRNLAKAGVSVDYFGKCFEKSTQIPYENVGQLQRFLSEYKFYFAFENSYHCKDYITEKFFRNALDIGVVPVVWGTLKKDYEAIAPNYSFIHLEDFSSISNFAGYLDYLDKNNLAYLDYFRWYDTASKQSGYDKDRSYCKLCRMANRLETSNSDNIPMDDQGKYFQQMPKSPKSLYSWFYYGNNRDCLRTKLRIGPDMTKPH